MPIAVSKYATNECERCLQLFQCQIPPNPVPASTSLTLNPSLRSLYSRYTPAKPAPITTASRSKSISSPLRVRSLAIERCIDAMSSILKYAKTKSRKCAAKLSRTQKESEYLQIYLLEEDRVARSKYLNVSCEIRFRHDDPRHQYVQLLRSKADLRHRPFSNIAAIPSAVAQNGLCCK